MRQKTDTDSTAAGAEMPSGQPSINCCRTIIIMRMPCSSPRRLWIVLAYITTLMSLSRYHTQMSMFVSNKVLIEKMSDDSDDIQTRGVMLKMNETSSSLLSNSSLPSNSDLMRTNNQSQGSSISSLSPPELDGAWPNQTYATAQDFPPKQLLPPLESLVSGNQIIGNVSFLLDAAILGFAKCGTTTLSSWLDSHTGMKSIPGESFALFGKQPTRLIHWLWNMRHESLQNQNNASSLQSDQPFDAPKQLYKQPKDAYLPHVLQTLEKYWPNAKLIYTLRHPVLWFESYYNFRNSKRKQSNGISDQVIGRKGTIHDGISYQLHTGLGEFHIFMAMLGKTAQTTKTITTTTSPNGTSNNDADEWSLIEPFLKASEAKLFPFAKIPNQVFFLDSAQLSDSNQTRMQQLQQDLSHFLGLDQPLPLPIPHVKPETLWLTNQELQRRKANRVDICEARYRKLRQELLRIGAAAGVWLRDYFMVSPDVYYSSVDHSLEDLLESWAVDPCEERQEQQ